MDGYSGRIERLLRFMRLEGELTERQRARLLVSADRCPIHRTLEAEPMITTLEE